MALKFEDFKEGEFYLTAEGEIHMLQYVGFLEDNLEDNSIYPIETTYNNYTEEGYKYFRNLDDKDLIAHIPTPLMFEVLRVIEAYHTTDSFRSIINNCYKNHMNKKEK